jgi:hypothetical protein
MPTSTASNLSSEETPVVPVVGLPASYQVGSDRYAVTVVAVSKSGHEVTTRDAKSRLASGSIFSEQQRYLFVADPEGAVRVFTRRKNGRYVSKGNKRSGFLSLGEYSAYRDPSF